MTKTDRDPDYIDDDYGDDDLVAESSNVFYDQFGKRHILKPNGIERIGDRDYDSYGREMD